MTDNSMAISFTKEQISAVKPYVDDYVGRIGSDDSQSLNASDLRFVLRDGIEAAPIINREFKSASVPALWGLYLAMVESEYQTWRDGPDGSRGIFMMAVHTAQSYGVAPD